MKPTRYEPERSNVAMVAHPEGRFILYADAEKWMQEEVAALKEAKKSNRLCIGYTIDLEKQIAKREEEIAALKSLVDGASDIVEIYPTESPAQKEWKADWLAKAREVLE